MKTLRTSKRFLSALMVAAVATAALVASGAPAVAVTAEAQSAERLLAGSDQFLPGFARAAFAMAKHRAADFEAFKTGGDPQPQPPQVPTLLD